MSENKQLREDDRGKGKLTASEDDYCDLEPWKKCDNCFRCLGLEAYEKSEYARIPIQGVYLEEDIVRDG